MRHAGHHAGHCRPPLMVAMAGGGHGPWGGWGFGPGHRGGFGGPPRRPRSRRGDVRAALLLLLEEEPRNGYGLMQEVEERSDGDWRPSPGSIYPALAQLEDEGLIAPAGGDQGKAFALTDAGRAHVEEHREAFGAPWAQAARGRPHGVGDLRASLGQLAQASMQVAHTGDAEAVAKARRILDDARRSLYRMLAGDEPAA